MENWNKTVDRDEKCIKFVRHRNCAFYDTKNKIYGSTKMVREYLEDGYEINVFDHYYQKDITRMILLRIELYREEEKLKASKKEKMEGQK